MWLKTTSDLLPGLGLGAIFYTCFLYRPLPPPIPPFRAWGFWSNLEWIGPRHTNFPDGSICAFDPMDGTWQVGDPIVELLDIYTLWAVRQLHLRVYGRWPGAQSVPHVHERLEEFRDHELCGCAFGAAKTYAECCKPRDLKRSRIHEAIKFTLWSQGGLRKPPREVLAFSAGFSSPPSLKTVFPPLPSRP